MPSISDLQKFLLKTSLAGHKGMAELGNLMEHQGRSNIIGRIANLHGAEDLPLGKVTNDMWRESNAAKKKASQIFFDTPNAEVDLESAKEAEALFQKIFGR